MKFSPIQIVNVLVCFIFLIKSSDAVVGGTAAVDKQFPYMAFIWYHYDHPTKQIQRVKCTGVIVAPRWILTAASCFIDFIESENKQDNETMIFTAVNTFAVAGVSDGYGRIPAENYPGLQERDVEKIYIHQSFMQVSPMYDVNIALLRMTRGYDLRRGQSPYYVSSAALSTTFGKNDVMLSSSTFTGAMPCVVVGFGYSGRVPYTAQAAEAGNSRTTHDGSSAKAHELKYFPANAGGNDFCRNLRDWATPHSRELLDEFYACAKASEDNGGRACWGDNGAALVCGGKITGILSDRRERTPAEHYSCSSSKGYSVFTMVGHSETYDWIKRFVGAELPLLSPLPDMPRVQNMPH